MCIEITREQATYIIENPKTEEIHEDHRYWYESEGLFIGIDNSTCNAWVEDFHDKETCFRWLNGEFEMSDYLSKGK